MTAREEVTLLGNHSNHNRYFLLTPLFPNPYSLNPIP
jgi:hypothetical protein